MQSKAAPSLKPALFAFFEQLLKLKYIQWRIAYGTLWRCFRALRALRQVNAGFGVLFFLRRELLGRLEVPFERRNHILGPGFDVGVVSVFGFALESCDCGLV